MIGYRKALVLGTMYAVSFVAGLVFVANGRASFAEWTSFVIWLSGTLGGLFTAGNVAEHITNGKLVT